MKLLIYTQAIDTNNPLLGFFHRWVEEFAKHYEEVHVVCLIKGEYKLPANVFVYSLGKENGVSRIKYVFTFFVYLWKLRKKYNAVFVHMNPHYVVLGGWFWKVLRIPVFFWRNHARMNVMTRISAFFAKKVFYTSPFACTSVFKNSVQMPVGIDTDVFTTVTDDAREERSVLFLGRLSKVKRPELLIETARNLKEYRFYVYGNDLSDTKKYETILKQEASSNVFFYDGVMNSKTPLIYNTYEIYINLTPEGSMDKTILEAAACGTLILVTNKAFQGVVPDECLIKDESPKGIAKSIEDLGGLSKEQKQHYASLLRNMVIERHSLSKLMDEFVKYIH